jgi:hypothetical protein
VIQPHWLEIAKILSVIVLSTHGLPTSIVVMNEYSNGAFVSKDVWANNAKKLAHRARIKADPHVCNGWNADMLLCLSPNGFS